MKTKFVVACMFMMCVWCSLSMSATDSLVFNLKDGNTKTISLDDVSKITFGDGNVTVALTNGDSYATAITSISKIKFSDGTGVSTISINDGISIAVTSEGVRINGITDNEMLYICSISGSIVVSQPVKDGEAVSIEALQPGIYIVKISNHTFKFIKR